MSKLDEITEIAIEHNLKLYIEGVSVALVTQEGLIVAAGGATVNKLGASPEECVEGFFRIHSAESIKRAIKWASNPLVEIAWGEPFFTPSDEDRVCFFAKRTIQKLLTEYGEDIVLTVLRDKHHEVTVWCSEVQAMDSWAATRLGQEIGLIDACCKAQREANLKQMRAAIAALKEYVK